MKILLTALFALLTLTTAASAKDLVNLNWSGVAIKGTDPVAYFTDKKAVKGDPKIQSTYEGAIYNFASVEHKASFDKEPAKYVPQFGGFCAWAVSQGYTANIDPNAFQIVDGRLILQYSLDIREKFNADTAGNLKKADANWPAIVDKKGK
jgi:YHS domain-containing protein